MGGLNGIGDKHVKVALAPGESYDTKFASGLVSIRTGISAALALFYFNSHTDTILKIKQVEIELTDSNNINEPQLFMEMEKFLNELEQ